MNKNYTFSAGMIVLAAILFGLQPIYGLMLKGASVDVNGLMLVRFALPALLVGLLLLWRKPRFEPKLWARHAIMGIGFAITGIGYYQAGYQIGFSLAVILFYSFPVMVAIYSALCLRMQLRSVQIGAMSVASCGLLLATNVSDVSLSISGVAWALASAAGYAFVLIFKSHYAPPLDEWVSVFMLTLSAAVCVALFSVFDGIHLPAGGLDWAWSLALATFAGLIPIALIMRGSPVTGATDSATLCLIEPVVAVAVAVIVMNESASWNTYVGGAAVLTAALVLVRSRANLRAHQNQPSTLAQPPSPS